MNVAFLFDSGHPTLRGWAQPPIVRAILGSKVIQTSDREMRISVGDILLDSFPLGNPARSLQEYAEFAGGVFMTEEFNHLRLEKLAQIVGRSTVHCWLLKNVTSGLAVALDGALAVMPSYLGAMDVDFSNPLHLVYFRNLLPEKYRVRGESCSIFYHMGENEDPDCVERELFEEASMNVIYEDIGARGTIFDNYDSTDHFQRVADFLRVFSSLPDVDRDKASDLCFYLEELHPQLFDTLSAASLILEHAQTAEQIAQASLSGRRFLEQLADYLFPPRQVATGPRKLGKAEYRNRIWAYLEEILGKTELKGRLKFYGDQADDLIGRFNAGLHASRSLGEITILYRDLVIWLADVIQISPTDARKPYLAYTESLMDFAERARSRTLNSEQSK